MTQQVNTEIANDLETAAKMNKERCDAAAKYVLSNKYILANILRECVPEFNGYDIDFIVQNCFLDRVKIGSAAVHLDDIDKALLQRIVDPAKP